ncbi:LuxR C-terminal-related transcriptional regulator [Caulobacter sp. Root1472]|uniref:LuxR C-terminal-related transcriptional regulator n=1 Tax=Caulobacter sp. Root1472 TaxID=1736470 RepID=UPI0012E345CC|nr:helix-turn-helix transcriptional regulator [Caulobacter sp. Root1472]
MVDSGDNLGFERLTPREREILRLIAQHRQSKEIARLLSLSPKTVEMHVLSARRRLAGLGRRDAALAFIAWETDPGNDYRKQSAELATAQFEGSSRFNSESSHDQAFHEQAFHEQPEPGLGLLHRELAVPRRGPDLDGGNARARPAGGGDGLGPAQGAGGGRSSGQAASEGPGRDGLPGGRHAAPYGRSWRDDLTPLQWLGLILAVATLGGILLGTVTMGAHEFLYALQRFREGWSPPPAP